MKRILALLLVLCLLPVTVGKAAEEVLPEVIFAPDGGGKFLYCNNPEAILPEHLASTDNGTPTYLMSNPGLGPDRYTVFASHGNYTEKDIEVDLEFHAEERAVVRITAVGFEVAKNDEAWNCIGTWADYRQLPIRQRDGGREYIPRRFEPVEFELCGDSRWMSEFVSNYSQVHLMQCVSFLLDFEIVSGEVDVNIAALTHTGTLRDRSQCASDAAPGRYVWEKQIKGVADTLPSVSTELQFTLDGETPLDTALPVKIRNQYYPEGNVVDTWATHLSPQADDWSKDKLVESDMLAFTYADDSKLSKYGPAVPEERRDNIWRFDVFHSDADSYQPGAPFTPETFEPNYRLSPDNRNSALACCLGNYAVRERYHFTVTNEADAERVFEFTAKTGANLIVGLYDEAGRLLNPDTLQPEDAFLENKGYLWNESRAEKLARIPVAPGETRRFTLELTLPTNCFGGIACSVSVSDQPVEYAVRTELPAWAAEPLPSGIQKVGDGYLRFADGTLSRSEDGVNWEEQTLPEETRAQLGSVWDAYEITEAEGGYLFRFAVYDDGFEPSTPWALGLTGRVYLLDEGFHIQKSYNFNSYVYRLEQYDGVYYAQTGEGLYSTDFVNWKPLHYPAPLVAGDQALVLDGGTVARKNESGMYLVDYERREVQDLRRAGDYFYYKKSWKQSSFDFETQNIVSFSRDGIYWFDAVLPDRLLVLDGVIPGEGELIFDCRFERFAASTENADAAFDTTMYLNLNGEVLGFEAAPVLTAGGSSLVPIRLFFEKLGAEVSWDEGVATVTKEGQTIVFRIGEAECLVNGRPEQMIAPAQLIGEKTMVPLRFLSETLGYQVSWDEPTKTAFVIG